MRIDRALWLVSLVGIVIVSVPLPSQARSDDAPGGPDGKGPCVRACTQANKGCVQTAHRLKDSCRASCSPQRLDFFDACDPNGDGIFDFNPGDAVIDEQTGEVIDPCTTAKAALDSCLMPCKRTFKGAAGRCVLRLRHCFLDQCGIAPPPPNIDDTTSN